MTRERVDEMLRSYRETRARRDYLLSQVEILEQALKQNEASMIDDRVTLSQAMTGMPHGTTVGDPVGNLALDLVMGKVTVFVEQIQEELKKVRLELNQKQAMLVCIEAWLSCLNAREMEVVQMKLLEDCSWAEVVNGLREKFGKENRVSPVFTLRIAPPEKNVILYDDIITTGLTVEAMRNLLVNAGYTVLTVISIDNH